MACFSYDNYRGEIQCDGQRFQFGRADLGDARRIAQMYADVSINANNYKERLEPSATGSFSRVGGMFQIHTEQSVRGEIMSGRSFFALIKDSKGDIVASFWVSVDDPHFSGFSPSGFPGCGDCRCTLEGALRDGTVVYPRELIVSARDRRRGIAHAAFFTIFTAMRQNGYTHSLGEVYGVHSYLDGGPPIVVDMLNARSFRMTAGTGGRCIGVFPRKDITIDNFTVTIESRVFCFDYSAMLPGLARRLKDLGFTIRFENLYS